jgi:periplasmic divalent cation tolerance protein
MSDVFWVYVTVENDSEAKQIAKHVVEERLAACANIMGGIQSVYWWEGKVCEGKEAALVMKTSTVQKAALIDRIKQLHSYDCPCIVCLPIVDGNADFLKWIASETKK